MKKLIELIESAFCWEGGARATQLPTSQQDPSTTIMFAVVGSSTVEHQGDVDGIYSQVAELRGQTVVEDGITYRIVATRCTVKGHPQGDEDYTVRVTGTVEVTTKQ